MKNFAGALFASVLSIGVVAAQTTATPTPTFQTAVTTGMVGLGASQTAQLHVINITVLPLGVGAAVACPVELDFYDAQGQSLKTTTLSNVAPAASASLNLKISDFPTSSAVSLHTLVRGVVRTNPASSTGNNPPTLPVPITGGVIAVPPIYAYQGCNVLTTLEVFDSTSGVTQIFTSDTRPWQQSFFQPLFTRGN